MKEYGYRIGNGQLITSTATATNIELQNGIYILQWVSGSCAINLLGEATENDYTLSIDIVESPPLEIVNNSLSTIGIGTFRAIQIIY